MPRERSAISDAEANRYKKIATTLEQVAKHYRTCLKSSSRVEKYLQTRGIEMTIAEEFMLGVAPNVNGDLKQHFGKDYDEKILIDAGVLSHSQSGAVYERFKNRLMFPIRNRRGQVIAFGGRVLPGDDAPAKYINSPETKLFQKRNELYGMYELRKADQYDRIIVVEGYMDVVSLAQHGVRNVIATLGTASTRVHIKKMFRMASHIVFCFDGDEAGRKAAVRAMEQALPVFTDGNEIDFMFLPQGHDPDSFIREYKKDGFDTQVQKAQPIADFMLEHYVAGLNPKDPAAGAVLAQKAAPLLSEVPAGVFRERMYSRLAETIGVTVDELQHIKAKSVVPSKPLQATNARKLESSVIYSSARVAMILLLQDPKLAEMDVDISKLAQLNRRDAKLLVEMINTIREHHLTSSGSVLETYRGTEYEKVIHDFVAQQNLSEDEVTRQTEFSDAIKSLERDLVKQEIEQEIKKLNTPETDLSQEQCERLDRLLKQKVAMDSQG